MSESSVDEPESEEAGTGWGDGAAALSHVPSPRWSCAGMQLDGLLEKHCSCSMLTAYATPCSILLPLALHKKCGEGENK